tara:strand:+ start:726 stop:986 length:261 start_codon:yes stop_codon:yes gene_type:complete
MKTKALDVSTGQLINIEEPDVVVTDEENLIWLRTRRNEMLAQSDWTQNRDITLSKDADWKTYRQALRDITKTYKTLDTVKWPEKPE